MSKSFSDYPHPAESVPFPLPDITHPLVICMGLLFLLVTLLVIDRVCSFLRARKRKAKALAEAYRQCPAPQLPHFASEEHVDAVYMYAKRSLYQFLLVELQCVLKSEGFTMVTGRSRSAPLSDESKERVSRHLFMAQQQYCAMYGIYRGDIATDKYYDSDEAWRLCLGLLKGSEAIGWYVARIAQASTASQASASSSGH